jgi:hypothetical protein
MAKLIVSLIFSTILIFQLTCNLPISPVSPDKRIYGSWNYVRSDGTTCCGGTPGILINFGTTGIFSFYRNDSLLYTRIFTIAYEEFGYIDTETTNVVEFVGDHFVGPDFLGGCVVVTGQYEIQNDTLEIWYLGGMGGCRSTYSREKSIP